MTATLVTGRVYSPDCNLTLTLGAWPSDPGKTSCSLPTDHFPRIALVSATTTISFTRTLRFSFCYTFLGTSTGWTSRLQRFQKEFTNVWPNSTRFLGFLVLLNGPWGTSDVARPRSMSLGHKYFPPSGSLGTRPIGRWFTRLPISMKDVCSSNGERSCSPMEFFLARLQPLKSASVHPFWWGAAGVVKIHWVPV